ncbi:MAG: hypothetical protein FJ216_02590 [Ignavibacteria bacterium]|nr:hypothetical protein [Ignavibacteria bacterium]
MSEIQKRAKKYAKIKTSIYFFKFVFIFLLLILLILLDFFRGLEKFSYTIASVSYPAFLIFCFITFLIFSTVNTPVNIYSEFILETKVKHKYKLSNQA